MTTEATVKRDWIQTKQAYRTARNIAARWYHAQKQNGESCFALRSAEVMEMAEDCKAQDDVILAHGAQGGVRLVGKLVTIDKAEAIQTGKVAWKLSSLKVVFKGKNDGSEFSVYENKGNYKGDKVLVFTNMKARKLQYALLKGKGQKVLSWEHFKIKGKKQGSILGDLSIDG